MKRILGVVGLALVCTCTAASSQVFQKVSHLEDEVNVVMFRSVGPLEPEKVENIMRGMIDTEKAATYLYLYPYNVGVRPDPIAKETDSQSAIRLILRDETGADWRWSLKYVQSTGAYTFIDFTTPNPKCNTEKRL